MCHQRKIKPLDLIYAPFLFFQAQKTSLVCSDCPMRIAIARLADIQEQAGKGLMHDAVIAQH